MPPRGWSTRPNRPPPGRGGEGDLTVGHGIDDRPDVEAEVLACFTAYEEALRLGDHEATDAWFADDDRTVRFGVAEEQWGATAISRWRRTCAPIPAGRRLERTRIDVWGSDLAVVTTLFGYPGAETSGRQSQTWRRTRRGWRIVHAHVSTRATDP